MIDLATYDLFCFDGRESITLYYWKVEESHPLYWALFETEQHAKQALKNSP